MHTNRRAFIIETEGAKNYAARLEQMFVMITDAEKQVLQCLADGMLSKEIATRMRRSKPTIEGYIRILCIKLSARSRAQLVARAISLGLLDVEHEPFPHPIAINSLR